MAEDPQDAWPLLDDEERSGVGNRNEGDAGAGFEFVDDRLLLWNGTRLSTFDLESGRELFVLKDEVPDVTEEAASAGRGEASLLGRKIDGVVAADGVTVVSFQSNHIGRPPSARTDREYDAEGFLAAYDSDGQRLWSSSGDGVIEEDGPLYRASLDQCPQGDNVVFDEHFLAHGNNRKAPTVHVVDLHEGTVTWSLDIEDCREPTGSRRPPMTLTRTPITR